MVVKRRISRGKYFLAGFLTILIFSLGLTLGALLDNYRVKYIEDVSRQQEAEYKSLQFQYLYLTTLEEEGQSCPVLRATLEKTVNDLSSSLNKFLEYEKKTQLNKQDYNIAARMYLLDNLRYWIFAKKSKEKCGLDIVNILYFYSEDCTVCPSQGIILSYYKKIFGEKLLVFPINVDLEDEPMIKILLENFDITTYPTLIIEGKKYEDVVRKDELKELICSSFENADECEEIS